MLENTVNLSIKVNGLKNNNINASKSLIHINFDTY